MSLRIQVSAATVKALHARLQQAYLKDDVRLVRRTTVLIFQEAALARPKGAWPVVANHRLSAVFSFSRRLSPPKVFEPTSFQLVVV